MVTYRAKYLFMIITMEERKKDPNKELLFQKLARVSYKVKDRVLNPKFKQYKNYGGRGVTIDSKWLTSAGFIEDVDKIDGWNEAEFLAGNLELDKDIKIKGNTHYCKENTMWVTHEVNMQTLPEVQKPFYAYNQYTQEIKEGLNVKLFSEENNVNSGVISNILHGRKHKSGDWWVWYKDANTPEIYRVYYKGIDGSVYWDVNSQRLSNKLGKNRGYISQRILHNDKLKHGEYAWKEKVDLDMLLNKYNA